MNNFESYVFEKDELLAHNQDVIRERPLLISYLILILGFLIAIFLDYLTLGIWLIVIGLVLQMLARFSVLTPKRRTGQLNKELTISDDMIQIDSTVFNFAEVQSVHIKMYYHTGQIETDFQQNWKIAWTNNEIIIIQNGRKLKFNYLLPSFQHVMALRNMDFPNNVTKDDRVF